MSNSPLARSTRKASSLQAPGEYAELVQRLNVEQEPPAALLRLIGQALRNRMRRRGFWCAVPANLGYDFERQWRTNGDAFQAIVLDAYLECIVWRLVELKLLVDHGNDIDGCVKKNIHRFLVDRHRKYNPREYKFHMNCESAIVNMHQRGELLASPVATSRTGVVRLKRGTIISFGAGGSSASAAEIEQILMGDDRFRTQAGCLIQRGVKARKLLEAGVGRLRLAGLCEMAFADFRAAAKRVCDAAHRSQAFGNWPSGYHRDAESGDLEAVTWDETPVERVWVSSGVHRAIGDSSYSLKVRNNLHLVEAVQHDEFAQGRTPSGATQMATRWGGSKQTWSDHIQRLQKIRRSTLLDTPDGNTRKA